MFFFEYVPLSVFQYLCVYGVGSWVDKCVDSQFILSFHINSSIAPLVHVLLILLGTIFVITIIVIITTAAQQHYYYYYCYYYYHHSRKQLNTELNIPI